MEESWVTLQAAQLGWMRDERRAAMMVQRMVVVTVRWMVSMPAVNLVKRMAVSSEIWKARQTAVPRAAT